MSELYEQRDKYYDRIVSVRGKLTMSPSAHPGNLLKLHDLLDPNAISALYMDKEAVDRVRAENEKAVAEHMKRHGGKRVYYPLLLLDPLASVYDLRGEESVTVPEIYDVEISTTRVLRGLQNKCLIVTGYIMDRPGEWHAPEVKYVGAMVPIAMKPCDDKE